MHTLLVANRGEIACRVIRTAQALGLRTVAVYSDADAQAAHVALADDAVHIGPAEASASYLSIDALLEAAARSEADAIHPGYGFLSENADFVDAVESAGLVFVGPSAAAMRAMGLKDAAKRLMQAASVPVVPGYHAGAQDEATLAAAAADVGYPVLIKARAGGGGKGMRRVDAAADFGAALAGARREAAASFGDDAMLIEKYITSPRHIEVQVFGDTHGNVVHLYERDCSLQRRHQKVLEEAPAPGLPEDVRAAMLDAAVRAAQAIDYTGAGTLEFIVDGSGTPRVDGFWFMEMNTRLQVEHPVTEAITGIDLVEWQLRVARGEVLPLLQQDIACTGHALEARLYAEDPASGFLPQTGSLEMFALPGGEGLFDSNGLRVDSGVRQGDAISPHYDPMLAKLIAWGPDRQTALARLGAQLERSVVLGSVTNRAFLARLARHEDVRHARLDTGLIERELGTLTAIDSQATDQAIAAWLLVSGVASDPRDTFVATADGQAGFRLWGEAVRQVEFSEPSVRLTVRGGAQHWRVAAGESTAVDVTINVVDCDGLRKRALIELDGRRVPIAWWRGIDRLELQFGNRHSVHPLAILGAGASQGAGHDAIIAPMPGRVLSVQAAVGDDVTTGQTLVLLEAMKMEHALTARRDGRIESVRVSVGDQVAQGDVMLSFESDT